MARRHLKISFKWPQITLACLLGPVTSFGYINIQQCFFSLHPIGHPWGRLYPTGGQACIEITKFCNFSENILKYCEKITNFRNFSENAVKLMWILQSIFLGLWLRSPNSYWCQDFFRWGWLNSHRFFSDSHAP